MIQSFLDPTNIRRCCAYSAVDRSAETALLLEQHGYDQVPTASNWATRENTGLTVEHCYKVIAPEHVCGFLIAPWKPALPACHKHHLEAIRLVGAAKKQLENEC